MSKCCSCCGWGGKGGGREGGGCWGGGRGAVDHVGFLLNVGGEFGVREKETPTSLREMVVTFLTSGRRRRVTSGPYTRFFSCTTRTSPFLDGGSGGGGGNVGRGGSEGDWLGEEGMGRVLGRVTETFVKCFSGNVVFCSCDDFFYLVGGGRTRRDEGGDEGGEGRRRGRGGVILGLAVDIMSCRCFSTNIKSCLSSKKQIHKSLGTKPKTIRDKSPIFHIFSNTIASSCENKRKKKEKKPSIGLEMTKVGAKERKEGGEGGRGVEVEKGGVEDVEGTIFSCPSLSREDNFDRKIRRGGRERRRRRKGRGRENIVNSGMGLSSSKNQSKRMSQHNFPFFLCWKQQ